MPYPEQLFRWTWELRSSPESLWPLVSNTDRFNRDCGYPTVTLVPPPARSGTASRSPAPAPLTNTKHLRTSVMGVPIAWEERPFDWIAPRHFGVERIYSRGPVAKMLMRCELSPRADGGTTLVYEMRLTPANVLGRLALPYSIGRSARAATERVFRRYDEFAQQGLPTSQLAQKPQLAPGGPARLAAAGQRLTTDSAQPADLIERLSRFLATSDDLSAARIRPYELADTWHADRRAVLSLCLHATRAGLLDFSWDVLCPHCRGARPGSRSLDGLTARSHCDSCDVDFTGNFDQSIELTFTPNPSVRPVARVDYCIGGPQLTPHILAQKSLQPGETIVLPVDLAPGRYQVRSPGAAAAPAVFRVEAGAPSALTVMLGAEQLLQASIAPRGELTLANSGTAERLAIVESIAWSDQSTTAAEVTSLQLFRDLFSREVIRLGEQISVGAMTVVFTDLKNSTRLYTEIGDAPAFGRVLTHFEVLKAAVAAENGAIVKTMGDAIMAVFPRPVSAVRAMIRVQRRLAHPADYPLPAGGSAFPFAPAPLALKAGIHTGPCLAINQNERLDYFGTNVNLTARLCGLSTGEDLVLSDATHRDHEVAAYLADPATHVADSLEHLSVTAGRTTLKGFADTFDVWRVRSR